MKDWIYWTIQFYRAKLKLFTDYIGSIDGINPSTLREFMTTLSETHNAGWVHCVYRAVKTFLLWYEQEVEPEGWHNPIRKVKPPKVPTEPLEAISLEDVSKMLEFCGVRDRAILLVLLDTGLRTMELLNILISVDGNTGEILIRSGKGRKPRTVYLGAKSRKALRDYLKTLVPPGEPYLWLTDEGTRLTYTGLRMMLMRRAKQAGIKTPSIHSFRRAFAISMLRGGVDLITLANLMGHTSLSVLQRYLKQTSEDTRLVHRRCSPVDNGL